MNLKSTLLGSAFALACAMPAVAQDAPDYSTNYDGVNNSRTDRSLTSFSLTTSADGVQTVSPSGSLLVQDLTATTTLQLTPGESVKLNVNYDGTWMHSYIYIDFNNNGFQGIVDEATGVLSTDAENDLLMHSGYLTDYTNDYSCVNGLGATTDPATSVDNVPEFTLPADLEPGTYRARVKVDWSCVDPKGCTGHEKGGQIVNKMDANGGFIIDFMVEIVGETDGISSVAADKANGAIYDLMGRKVANPSNGIYIQNGKKFVVK